MSTTTNLALEWQPELGGRVTEGFYPYSHPRGDQGAVPEACGSPLCSSDQLALTITPGQFFWLLFISRKSFLLTSTSAKCADC